MSYTSENIFADPRLNALCDRIYELMYIDLPPTSEQPTNWIYLAFALSGRAAAILQDETVQPVKNIVFQTSNAALWEWCRNNLAQKFGNCKRIAFKNRILVYPNDYFFEIILSEGELDIVNYATDINLINKTVIPEETL